ncbi:MAG TPA: hypothetical protein VIV57_21990 [Anaeromyxobacter sp.]
MHFSKRLAAIATMALLAGSLARADTVDVTSTTLLRLGQETRGGQSLQKPDLATVAPAFEILSISARGVRNPLFDDLAIVVSTWGSYELADRRWDDGTGSNLTGDVVTGYVQGKLLDRRLTLRLGREQVATGAARMIHIDGGEAIAVLPLGVRLSAYGGVPVSQRFTTRRAIYNWNPAGGDLAYGGRVAWTYGLAGFPGRGIDVGLSTNFVFDHKDPVREEAAVDLRLQPTASVFLTGIGAYSLYDDRVSEVGGRLTWTPIRMLRLEGDAKHVAPDLLLARNSILSVFTAEERQQYGGGAFLQLGRGLQLGLTGHLDVEPGRNRGDKNFLGSEAEARVEWERGHTLAGAEILFLDALDNGYFGGRIFGRREMGRFFAAADVLAHFFREKVNGETMAVTGALTGGIELARGFSAVISGRAGVTPFFEQTYDVMAKLVYNSTYQVREVR